MADPKGKDNIFRNKVVCATLLLGIAGGILLGILISFLVDGFNTNWYSAVLLFFLIIEALSVLYVEDKSRKVESKKLVNVYMLSKLVKIFLSLFLVTIYALTVGENIKQFILGFISLYFMFLIIESCMFVRIEKHLKKNNNKE